MKEWIINFTIKRINGLIDGTDPWILIFITYFWCLIFFYALRKDIESRAIKDGKTE